MVCWFQYGHARSSISGLETDLGHWLLNFHTNFLVAATLNDCKFQIFHEELLASERILAAVTAWKEASEEGPHTDSSEGEISQMGKA